MEQEESIPREEAMDAIKGALSRIALLHVSFSKAIIEELGEEKGRDLITKAIIELGHGIIDRKKRGLPDSTPLGLHDDAGQNEEGKDYVKGCAFAKVFKEQDAMDVGYLYCYVEAAKYMAMAPEAKMIHSTCEACGDDDCIIEIVQTSEQERYDFENRNSAWREVDSRLVEYGEEQMKD